MKSKTDIRAKFDELVKSRNAMSLDTHGISTMMATEHEIYALAWVLEDVGKIVLPFQEASVDTHEKRSEQ